MANSRTIAVLGAGAVGCYLGGHLSWTRTPVTLIGRQQVTDAIQHRGLVLKEAGHEMVVHPKAVSNPEEVAPVDLLLLTVRAFDVADLIPTIRPLLKPDGLVLAVQNGVGTDELLAATLGREHILAGTITARVGMESPGVVTRYSERGGVAIAAMQDTVPDWVIDCLRRTGLPFREIEDYRSLRWSKLLLNMLGAASSAILDLDISSVAADPDLFRVEQLAIREVGRVMDTQGIRTVNLPGYPARTLRLAMRLPRSFAQRLIAPRLAGARGGQSPTMRADLARGRSEIDWFNGAVSRVGQALEIPTPVNDALTLLMREALADPGRRTELEGNRTALLAAVRARRGR